MAKILSKNNIAAGIVFLVALLFHLQLATEARVAISVTYFLLLIMSLAVRQPAVFLLTLYIFLWRTAYLVLPDFLFNISAVYFVVIFAVTTPIIWVRPTMRPALAWFRKGAINRQSILWATGMALASVVALLLWAFWTHNMGIGEKIVLGFSDYPHWLIFLIGVPLIASLNAFAEEVVFRGVFQEAGLRAGLNPLLAILLQASAFAAAHFAEGFPNGYLGYAMTFVYAVVLGGLRQKTNGILLPFITHIVADLVIMYYLCFKYL